MKTKYKHIYFEKGPQLAGCPAFFYCKNNSDNRILGDISYYPDWKKYVFEGKLGCVFDAWCLADIIEFMNQL